MILTKENNILVSNTLVAKPENLEKIRHLYSLYTTPNFEYGYLEHGAVWYTKTKPEHVSITKDYIAIYDKRKRGKDNHPYPVEYCTTKAKNTLIVIEQILTNKQINIALKNFFSQSNKQINEYGYFVQNDSNFEIIIKKLDYLLQNKELGLEIIKDAYLDFYLFLTLLPLCNIESRNLPKNINSVSLNKEAEENTQILSYARKLTKY